MVEFLSIIKSINRFIHKEKKFPRNSSAMSSVVLIISALVLSFGPCYCYLLSGKLPAYHHDGEFQLYPFLLSLCKQTGLTSIRSVCCDRGSSHGPKKLCSILIDPNIDISCLH